MSFNGIICENQNNEELNDSFHCVMQIGFKHRLERQLSTNVWIISAQKLSLQFSFSEKVTDY